MGTNVYLRHSVCQHCDRPASRIHVGKSSGGWAWLWRGYRGWEAEDLPFARPILSGDDWWEVLAASLADEREPGQIVDEYGKVLTLDELRTWVESKRNATHRASEVPGSGDFAERDGPDEIAFREFS